MMKNEHKPLILLTFANDRYAGGDYLRNLPEENRRIREALAVAKAKGWCDVEHLPNVTATELLDAFQQAEQKDRVAILHFGGHAGSFELLLEDLRGKPLVASAAALAGFLGQQKGLKLVFLNGCATEKQVEDLLAAGIPAVIATSQKINDEDAMRFAARFYKGIGSGSAINRAFIETVEAIKLEKSGNPRRAYPDEETAEDHWPWQLYPHPLPEQVAGWRLQKPPKKWWERLQTRMTFAVAIVTLLSFGLDLPGKITKSWRQFIGTPAISTPFKGIVVDGDNGPVGNAVVKINLLPGDSTTTTSDGSFKFLKVPGKPGDGVRVYVFSVTHGRRNEFATLPGPVEIKLRQE